MVLLFAALTAVVVPYMTAVAEPALRYGIGGVAAGFLSIGLASLGWLAMGYGRGERSLEAILRRTRSGEMPDDGEVIIATGRVRALGPALVAPLSGTPCVGYRYRMYETSRDSDGQVQHTAVYWGAAARPFALHASTGVVRVFAIPLQADGVQLLAGETAVERARQWIRTAPFQPTAGPLGVLRAGMETLRDVFTDDDGEARHDWKRADMDRDPASLLLEETVLPIDAEATVHGTWSRARGAVVAGGGAAMGVQLVLGPPERLAALTGAHSFGRSLAAALVMIALGAGVVWLGARGLEGF